MSKGAAFARAGMAALFAGVAACTPARGGDAARAIRVTGSDTMVNLVQAWAETYARVAPSVSVQVAGGGSGVGIAGLVNGTLDIAAVSREMTDSEARRIATRTGGRPDAYVVALDAIVLYVHPSNPLDAISLDALAAIYGDGERITRWTQLGAAFASCRSGAIVRIGRQNSSGTYAYFRTAVLGAGHDFRMGSIDQSGSKDVATLVSRTPCAIGYSGMAFATPGVKALRLRPHGGGAAIPPSAAGVLADAYPLARPLYLLTAGAPRPDVRRFLEWVLSPDGQAIARDLGFVPAVVADDDAVEGAR